jgi:hypothetical protein
VIEWLRKLSFPTRVLVYAAAAVLAFAVAAGIGATMALMINGDLSLPAEQEPGPAAEQDGDTPQHRGADADRSQQQKAADQQDEAGVERNAAATQQDEVEYVRKVGDIQANSTETFLDSHAKLLRYDSLTADDIERMEANQAALQEITEQVASLDPPQRYGEQYEVFRSAINDLHEAARLAYNLAADPVSATQSDFGEYERHVNEATTHLQRSNEILGREFQTLESVKEVSPS